ncbi:MAG: nitroreductase family protein [Butyrivibrio sp.]|nr:nitroreductase family protein [Butyrivibrio sp.]
MNTKDCIEKRSSTRSFTEEKLSKEQIDAIIDAGLFAPTGQNKKEIFFTVVDGQNEILSEIEDEKHRMRGEGAQAHNFYYEAPTVVFLSAEEDFKWSKVDAGIAVENMALIAEDLGIGSLIIGSIYDALHGEKRDYFMEKLQIPKGKDFQIAIALGFKATTKAPHDFNKDEQVKYL